MGRVLPLPLTYMTLASFLIYLWFISYPDKCGWSHSPGRTIGKTSTVVAHLLLLAQHCCHFIWHISTLGKDWAFSEPYHITTPVKSSLCTAFCLHRRASSRAECLQTNCSVWRAKSHRSSSVFTLYPPRNANPSSWKAVLASGIPLFQG